MELTSTDDEHDPEGQTTAVDRSRTEALLAGAERHLEDLDAAELRLEEGTYGVCEVCGRSDPARSARGPADGEDLRGPRRLTVGFLP
jgi:DnaK suppressor protein